MFPPPAPPLQDFGTPTWVKEIITTSHTNSEVKLRDLITPDPDFPGLKDWRNGEPDEIEVEWQLMQIDYTAPDGGARGKVVAAPQVLNQGDDVVTRRYEFYDYVGPTDAGSGEVLVDTVAPDGLHGGTNTAYADTLVVGQYLGAQMSAFAAVQPLGLIDHLPDGVANTPYPTRTVVIASDTHFTASSAGALPDGLIFDPTTARIYGTPTVSGQFQFRIRVSQTNGPTLAHTYSFSVADAGVILPPHSSVDTISLPLDSGTTSGDGVYTNGTVARVTAQSLPGFAFVNWTDNGQVVSTNRDYSLNIALNHSLAANFIAVPEVGLLRLNSAELVLRWPTNFAGFIVQESPELSLPNWTTVSSVPAVVGTNFQATLSIIDAKHFYRLTLP